EFWQGVEQFNQRQFYACHDTLESLWMESGEPEKKFYQGVLQIAVGCYHLQNHNWRGAVILLGEGINRISYFAPVYSGINVTELLTSSQQLLTKLQQSGTDNVVNIVKELESSQNQDLTFPVLIIIEEI
ncbi:MAG TPA: DUF309 domain-containing protein, partial [Allocoleopsis sp.]